MKKRTLFILVFLILLAIGLVVWYRYSTRITPTPIPTDTEKHAEHATMKKDSTTIQKDMVVIDPVRLQSIGVTYELVQKRPMEKMK